NREIWSGMDEAYLMQSVKLMLALDLDIEPEIDTLDSGYFKRMFNYYAARTSQEAPEYDLGISFKEKQNEGDQPKRPKNPEWHDSTEFEGYHVGFSQHMSILKTDDG